MRMTSHASVMMMTMRNPDASAQRKAVRLSRPTSRRSPIPSRLGIVVTANTSRKVTSRVTSTGRLTSAGAPSAALP